MELYRDIHEMFLLSAKYRQKQTLQAAKGIQPTAT